MNKKLLVALSLFFSFIMVIVFIYFFSIKIDFSLGKFFVNVLDLGDTDYEFPEPKEFEFNIENINFTTDRQYFIKNGTNFPLYYEDENNESFITINSYYSSNMSFDEYYDYILKESMINIDILFEETQDNGFKYVDYVYNGYYYTQVFINYQEIYFTIAFSCKSEDKDKLSNSFRAWAKSLNILSEEQNE